MIDIDGHGVFVSGGASGIGRATAHAFADAGARVSVVDRDGDGARAVAEAIGGAGGHAVAIEADLSDPDRAADAVARTRERLGRLDAAVNCAGILGPVGKPHEAGRDRWREVMGCNLDAVFWCLQAQAEAMLDQGGGSIVNIASAAGLVGFPYAAAYTASKHAVVGLTRTAAIDYAEDGIRVNAIAPGGVDTPLIRATTCATPEGKARIEGLHPMKRLANPAEIASAAVYLCAPAASFVTGTVMPVDGGWTAQ